jgi:Protein of unknown function (DUF3106)
VLSGRTQIARAVLATLCLMAVSVFAQHPAARPHQKEKIQERRQERAVRESEGAVKSHAGDWLRRYKDLPPDEQRQALEKDSDFQKLAPQRQAQLLQRLQRFSSLPAQQQDRILSRMETWEHLTRDQKLQARELFQQIQQLPQPRRRALSGAIRGMRDLTPEQREQIINSDRYKSMFSDHERELLSGAARLPLAPGDGSQGDTPSE